MIYKLSHWAKKDGIVVINMSYTPEYLERLGLQVDHRGWAQGFPVSFLGQEFPESIMGREDAWVDLIKSAGLEIIDIDREDCMVADGRSLEPEAQFYIITRRTQVNPLIGPFPLPDIVGSHITVRPEAWKELSEKMEINTVNKAICEALRKEPKCHRVLCVSKGAVSQILNNSDIEFQQTSELPSSEVHPASFDCVVLDWMLHLVPSPGEYIDHAIKAVSLTGNTRMIIIQAAPDNEIVNLINEASEGLGLPMQHHGLLLNEAEKKCKAAGFQTIKYIRTQGSINFGSLQGDEKVESAASLLSRVYAVEGTTQEQLKERLQNILKIHFSFERETTSHTAILFAERIE